MKKQIQKKVFRAINENVAEKRFVPASDPTPKGWHQNAVDALAAYGKDEPKNGPTDREKKDMLQKQADKFGVTLDMRKSVGNLEKEVAALTDGNQ